MKVALVHDHLNQIGGAEKVLLVLREIFPEAPIFTLVYDEKGTQELFKDADIRTSFLQKISHGQRQIRKFLPLIPLAFEQFDFSDFDLVLSLSSAFAKGVLVKPHTLHFCYCHTPSRYLWHDHLYYVDHWEKNWFIGGLSKLMRSWLRIWDRVASQRPDYFIANSQTVVQRVKKYYNREAVVIYPPTEIDQFKISDKIENYFLIISRLRPYKRADLAIKTFNKLKLPLKVVGIGEEDLKKTANSNIEFLESVSEQKKIELLSKCQALIHPQEEDFGLTVIEAMASGRPVIAYKKGGALETVIEGKTGQFFEEQTWEALADAVIRFKSEKFNPQEIRNHSQKFSKENFVKKIKKFIEEKWKEFKIGLENSNKTN